MKKKGSVLRKQIALFGYRLVAGLVHFHVNTHEGKHEVCHD